MPTSKTRLLMIGVVLIAVAGCSSSRFGTYSTRSTTAEPLPPAPSGTVTGNELPPPGTAANESSAFPDAPAGADGSTGAQEDAQVAANAPEVTRETLVGAWKVSTGGGSCQMFMALTKWTGGYRAASRGCPGDAANVAAWDVKGKQVVLSDSDGTTVARLYSSGAERFDGQTTSGQPISLSR
jgi:hypothetical protein